MALALPAAAKFDRNQAEGAVCQSGSDSVQQIAQITNTHDSNIQCLGVKLDGHALAALRIENHRFDGEGGADFPNGVKISEFPLAQIESRRGAVLDGTKGHDAVIVQGSASPSDGNFDLVTSYLYNGLTGEYRSCRIKLDRRADAAWRLINQFNETVSRIVVRTRSVPVLGTIGIANLEGACTPTQS
ncbi:MAG TPA: hypothetical protein VH020_06880 [Stellaceae bacterium]|nr:hypothetical protein [Stellaceae bacterium]